ncbi:hypothetical protein ES703_49656 [subsurface metagenome]
MSQPEQKTKVQYTKEEKKTLSKTIEEVFIRFTSAIKTAQIFEPNNIAFQQQIKPLFFLIQSLLKNLGKAILQFRGNASAPPPLNQV